MAGTVAKNQMELEVGDNAGLKAVQAASREKSLSYGKWKTFFANGNLYPAALMSIGRPIPIIRDDGLYETDEDDAGLKAVLAASRKRSLTCEEWTIIFANKHRFPVINSTTIQTTREGLYRVDCREYLEKKHNSWTNHYSFHHKPKNEGDIELEFEVCEMKAEEWQGVKYTTEQPDIPDDEFKSIQASEALLAQNLDQGYIYRRWIVRQTDAYPLTFAHYYWSIDG